MNSFPMTPKGFKQVKAELTHLKTVERPKVVADIEEARSHGDLSENAEYDAAKEKQGFVEARIRNLEGKVARANVVDSSALPTDKVLFGLIVTFFDVENDQETTYQIVGEDEADLKNGKLSIASPLARALIGKRPGEDFTLKTPKGLKEYEVVSISL